LSFTAEAPVSLARDELAPPLSAEDAARVAARRRAAGLILG
jgi:hypothetical protein